MEWGSSTEVDEAVMLLDYLCSCLTEEFYGFVKNGSQKRCEKEWSDENQKSIISRCLNS